jgi:FkbM family methyltransferase
LTVGLRTRFYPRALIAAEHFRLRIDLRDHVIAQSLYRLRTWEPELLALFRGLDLSGGVCVDVGANLGWHTLALSACVGPAGRVFAFEPSPREYRLLLENLRLNNITNVVAERSALGERKETRWLRLNPRNWGDNRIVPERRAGEQDVSVPVHVGDEVLAALPAGAIKLVKVDAQGYDHFVVKGLHETLRRNPDAVLAVEVEPAMLHQAGTSAGAFVAYLLEQGFSGWDLQLHRAFPLLAPEYYEIVDEAGSANLVVSRRPEALALAIGKLFPGPTRSS